jgi:serine/threonine-protein kinase
MPRERRSRTRLLAADVLKTEAPGLVGQTLLERYVVDGILGAGAMGVVYKAHHTKLGREVAIKLMHDHLENDEGMLARFQREAVVAGKLHHKNVVAVIDVGEHAGRPAMVMELALGSPLTTLMAEGLSRARAISLCRQIAAGLDHAHGLGLVHRDLKPDNVIVEADDVPRIVDFGIAFLRDPDASDEGGRLTSSGIIVGTPQYMAPEQARGGDIDHRVDLFSLGMILYEIVARAPAFTGTAMEVAVANMTRDVPPVPGLDGLDGRLLDRAMRTLLAREVADRFQSAREVGAIFELLATDPDAAGTALGVIDLERALATIGLPR